MAEIALPARHSDDFVISEDRFEDLSISAVSGTSFYYFALSKPHRLIKQFVLMRTARTTYLCHVTLIKNADGKFDPRMEFSIRDVKRKIADAVETLEADAKPPKARVDLSKCSDTFWKLISYLRNFEEIETQSKKFWLTSEKEQPIVAALRLRGSASVVSIIRQLSSTEGLKLSDSDISELLRMKEKLDAYEAALPCSHDEGWWQRFFEDNKWIFGYGLNYQILRQEADQPHYGGTNLQGRGAQRGDFLTATLGDIGFTVLVEIKTPKTTLLAGTREIRSGPGACL